MFGPSSGEEVLIVAATHKAFAGVTSKVLDLQKIIRLDMMSEGSVCNAVSTASMVVFGFLAFMAHRQVRPQWRPTVSSSSSWKEKSSAARGLYQFFGRYLDVQTFLRSEIVFRFWRGFSFCFRFVNIFGGLAFVSKKCMQLGTSVR